MTETEIIDQQEKGLRCIEEMRVKESEARQLGFENTAWYLRDQIKKAEKWVIGLTKQ